jgi:hypothetical protein
VFCQVTGEPLAPDMITKEFTAIVRKAGLPHLTLHGLRHMVATLLLKSGENPKIVQELLGHSNIAITMDTYCHVLPGMLAKAVRTLDSLVNGCNIGCKLDRITPTKRYAMSISDMGTRTDQHCSRYGITKSDNSNRT